MTPGPAGPTIEVETRRTDGASDGQEDEMDQDRTTTCVGWIAADVDGALATTMAPLGDEAGS